LRESTKEHDAMAGCLLPRPATGADDLYHVYALRFATLERNVRENFLITDLHDGPMPLDYFVWIVHGASRTILVDTGFGDAAATRRGRHRIVDPIDALRRLGIAPDDIDDVIISHLHYDHAGNLGGFGKARFHIQDKEVAYATGRCMCERFLRFPFDVEDIVAFVRHTYAERVCFHDGDANPLPGISLHLLPGHTAGIQAVRVNTPRGPVVLASDVSHYYANFLRRSPFQLTVDAAETLRSYEGLLALADGKVEHIIPGHDPWVRRLYPGCEHGGIQLSALHEPPMALDRSMLMMEVLDRGP
jgi:glyoxylase-like metal-dependent hydrolase (beta-lactamase superfamily II)